MDVRLSAEQQALRDSVVNVVDRLGPGAVRDLDDIERKDKLDAAVAASGWRELRAGSDTGAPWASGVEAAIVAEELARGLADVPFLGPTLAAELRRVIGAPPAVASETVVLSADLGSVVDGSVAVDAAGAATALVVLDGHRVVSCAVSGTPSKPVDLTRRSTVVDTSQATDIHGRALDDDGLAQWVALGLALTSAELVGTMRGAVQLTRDYALERHQYGAAIGSFQAVQHLLADAFVAMEGSRSAALHAAWAVDALAPRDALAAGAVAKAYCARAARQVCETAIQVHGGIGNTWECLAHVHLRRALLSTDVLGGTGPNLARVLTGQGITGGRDGLR